MAIAILKIPCFFLTPQRSSKMLRYFPVCAVSLLGIFASCGSAFSVYRWENAKARSEYARSADTLALTLQRNLDNAVKIARASAGLYEASEEITPAEFARFSRMILVDSPEILSLGFARQVLARDRANYERERGKIWEYNPSDPAEILPARSRPEYFPTTEIEPFNKLNSVLNYDRASHWESRIAIARARDAGTLSATNRLPLETGGLGFVLYSPVYRYGTEQNRPSFLGVSFIAFQVTEIVKASLKGLNLNTLDLYVYEMPVDRLESALHKKLTAPRDRFLMAYDAATQTFISSLEVSPKRVAPSLFLPFNPICPYGQDASNCVRTVNLQGQEWSLLVIPTAHFTEPPWRTFGVFGLGLLCTGFLALYLLMSLQRALQQENLVRALIVSENLLKHQKNELKTSLQQLQQTQLQLIHSEKMSSMGQLVAGIAHEINNPINFIYGNLNYALEYSEDLLNLISLYQQHYPNPKPEIEAEILEVELDYISQDFPKILQSMEIGAERIREIVESMRNFARKDEQKMKPIDVHSGIDSTLTILEHRMKEKAGRPKIEVVKDYCDCTCVECNAGQLNQVFMNLIANAIDALEEAWTEKKLTAPPYIWIQTQVIDNAFKIRIADNGVGIPKEIQQRLFDPFFTTKSVGKGTGLGLSISERIVTQFHHGKLYCESSPGSGATFWIEIPYLS